MALAHFNATSKTSSSKLDEIEIPRRDGETTENLSSLSAFGLKVTLMRTGLGHQVPHDYNRRKILAAERCSNSTRIARPPYIYEAINPETEIRIVNLLQPSTNKPEELHFTFITAKLSDKPSYEALSYVWGEPVFNDRIYVGETELSITSSLATALRQLRHEDRPRRLWVDAICIHQQDSVEKGHQVALMSQIYGQSASMISWLGEEYEETTDAVKILIYLADRSWKYGISHRGALDQGLKKEPREGVRAALEDLYPCVDWPKLTIFFSQEYFTRLWIVQEVALSPQVTMYNGSSSITFTDFTVAMQMILFMLKHTNLSQYWTTEYLNAWELVTMRTAAKSQEAPPTMFDLVTKNLNRGCANDLDRIYALLGLKAPGEIEDMKVDYSANVGQLYQDFALSLIRRKSLKPLHYAGKVVRSPQDDYETLFVDTKLPTWTPDWRDIWERVELSAGHNEKPIFHAATQLSSITIVEDEALPFIGIAGIIIDSVKSTFGTLLGMDEVPDKDLAYTIGDYPHAPFSIRQLYLEAIDGKAYPTGEDAEMALARTLVLDNRVSSLRLTLTKPIGTDAIKEAWLEAKKSIEDPDRSKGMFDWHIESMPYTAAVRATTKGRDFFITEQGYIGLGPVKNMPGDLLVAFHGAETPFVLRKIIDQRVERESGG